MYFFDKDGKVKSEFNLGYRVFDSENNKFFGIVEWELYYDENPNVLVQREME
ncbi:MAG: hypothetical protein AB1546_14960 [bacterium]